MSSGLGDPPQSKITVEQEIPGAVWRRDWERLEAMWWSEVVDGMHTALCTAALVGGPIARSIRYQRETDTVLLRGETWGMGVSFADWGYPAEIRRVKMPSCPMMGDVLGVFTR